MSDSLDISPKHKKHRTKSPRKTSIAKLQSFGSRIRRIKNRSIEKISSFWNNNDNDENESKYNQYDHDNEDSLSKKSEIDMLSTNDKIFNARRECFGDHDIKNYELKNDKTDEQIDKQIDKKNGKKK
eukprot:18860_1